MQSYSPSGSKLYSFERKKTGTQAEKQKLKIYSRREAGYEIKKKNHWLNRKMEMVEDR